MILETRPDIEVVAEAAGGREAIEAARLHHPDVALMDIRMPGLNGIEATRELLAAGGPAPRVLMLTTFDLDEYVYDALKAGASGFLLKNAPPDQLADGVRAIAAGESLLAPDITRRLIEEHVRRPRTTGGVPEAVVSLTDREVEVLRHVARGATNTEIAQTLVISEATVKSHVGRILGKLGLRDRVQADVLANECGLVRPGGA
jgi:DNA-binding NarL/FixJ family response regulator